MEKKVKLHITKKKPNTQTVQFRIDPETNKKLTELRKHYGVTNGVLIKEMINECFQSIKVQ